MMRLGMVAAMLVLRCAGEDAERPRVVEPRQTSVYPLCVSNGMTSAVTIRGMNLAGARVLLFTNSAIAARVVGVEHESKVDSSAPADLARVEVQAEGAAPGTYPFRLITEAGVTNELILHVVEERVIDEAASVSAFPAAVAGRIGSRGEVDTVWFEAKAGETIAFTATSGASAFDPSLQIAEPSGSWFDEGRLNRVAFNDEPLAFPGLSTDARLVHQFDRSGRYALQIRAFGGQGGPDFTYLLQARKGSSEPPLLHPRGANTWDERRFTRVLTGDWLNNLSRRGGGAAEASEVRTFEPVDADAKAAIPVMSVPGIVEGRMTKPAETHRILLRIDKPSDLAIEIETPKATMPRFNPVVRLMAADGAEVVTNVYTKRNNNGLYMMKMIQAKSTFTLRSAGDYLLEIRDITTDIAGDDFSYRVLVRPQVAHVGKAAVEEDHINLAPGEAKEITVNLDREEGFRGLVLLCAEGLPPGVSAAPGMANPVEKPPLPNGGRLERYVGKPQTATLMLTAAEDATPLDMPATVRVTFRTVSDGKPSAGIVVKEIPVMLIPRRPS